MLNPKLLRLVVPLTAALLAAGAAAEVAPWYVGAAASLQRESNLFRVGDNQVLPAGYSQSDTLYTGSLIAGFDQQISRQHAYGTLSLNSSRYSSNAYLDNTGHALKLGLDWAAAERVSGALTASSDRNLAQFNFRSAAGTVETAKNQQTTNRLDARVSLGGVTRLSADLALGLRRQGYSADAYRYLAYDQKHASLGARYRTSGSLTLGAAYRSTRIDYPNFLTLITGDQIGNRIDRRDLDLSANWTASGASTVDLRVSPTRIHYVNALDDSRSRLTGSALWTWQPSDRTRLRTTFSRDTGQSASATSFGIFGAQVVDYASLTTALKVEATQQLTGKIDFSASLTQVHRSLSDTVLVIGATPTLVDGSDRTLTPALGLTWNPARNSQVGCNLSRDRRSSDGSLTVAFSASRIGCSGQFVLQ